MNTFYGEKCTQVLKIRSFRGKKQTKEKKVVDSVWLSLFMTNYEMCDADYARPGNQYSIFKIT